MRMPSWAPRPVPTIRAVGVASPSAQGQAMISTATAAVNAAVGAGAGAEPEAEGGDRERDDDRHEDPGDAVGQPLHLGLAVLRVLDQPGHLGELGVGADPGGPHDEPAAGVDRGADDGVADADLDRHRLAGEHRGVDGGGALDDDAVGGDLLAGADDEPRRRPRARRPGTRVSTPSRSTATSLAPSSSRARSAAPARRFGAGLEVAAGQDEGGDAGRGLEVDVAGAVGALDGQLERVRHARARRRSRGTARRATSRARRACRARPACPWSRRRGAGWSRRRGGTASAPHTTTGAARVSESHCQYSNCSAGTIAIATTGTREHERDEQPVRSERVRVGRSGRPRRCRRPGSAARVARLLDGGEQLVGADGVRDR